MSPSETVPGCEDVAHVNDDAPPLSDDMAARTAHALAHPARLTIVRYLAAQQGCVAGEIFEQIDLAQSTVSEHLRVLREAGIVHSTVHGNRTYYCVVASSLVRFERVVEGLATGDSSMPQQTSKIDGERS